MSSTAMGTETLTGFAQNWRSICERFEERVIPIDLVRDGYPWSFDVRGERIRVRRDFAESLSRDERLFFLSCLVLCSKPRLTAVVVMAKVIFSIALIALSYLVIPSTLHDRPTYEVLRMIWCGLAGYAVGAIPGLMLRGRTLGKHEVARALSESSREAAVSCLRKATRFVTCEPKELVKIERMMKLVGQARSAPLA